MRSDVRIRNRFRFPWVALLAAACACCWAIFIYKTQLGGTVYNSISDGLPLLYRVSVTVAGSMMGFSMTITVFAMSLWNRGQNFVYTNAEPTYRSELWAAMRHATWSLGGLAIASAGCLLFSGDPPAVKVCSVPYLALVIFTAWRLSRAVRLVHKMAAVVIASGNRRDLDDGL